jgi:hypothetical protein
MPRLSQDEMSWQHDLAADLAARRKWLMVLRAVCQLTLDSIEWVQLLPLQAVPLKDSIKIIPARRPDAPGQMLPAPTHFTVALLYG